MSFLRRNKEVEETKEAIDLDDLLEILSKLDQDASSIRGIFGSCDVGTLTPYEVVYALADYSDRLINNNRSYHIFSSTVKDKLIIDIQPIDVVMVYRRGDEYRHIFNNSDALSPLQFQIPRGVPE